MMNQQLRQIIGVFFVFILRWINARSYSKMVHEIELEIIVSQETISNYPWSDYEDRTGATNNEEIQGLFKRDLQDMVDQTNWLFDNTFNENHQDGMGFKFKINKIYFDDTPVSRNWIDSIVPDSCLTHRNDANGATQQCTLERDEPQRIITRDKCNQYINQKKTAPGSVCVYLQPDKPYYFQGNGKAYTPWYVPGPCAELNVNLISYLIGSAFPNDIINEHSLRTTHDFRMIWMQFSTRMFSNVHAESVYGRSKYKGYLLAHELGHIMGQHHVINSNENGILTIPKSWSAPPPSYFSQPTKLQLEESINRGWFQCLNQIQITTDDEDIEDYMGNELLRINENYTGLTSRQLFN